MRLAFALVVVAACHSSPPVVYAAPHEETFSGSGSLTVIANVPGGVVSIDGDRRSELRDGRATIDEISAGYRRVEVTAPDAHPSTARVTIRNGETTELTIALTPIERAATWIDLPVTAQ